MKKRIWGILFVIWASSFALFLGLVGYYFYDIKKEEAYVKNIAIQNTSNEGILFDEDVVEHSFILDGDIKADVVFYAAIYYYSIPEEIRSRFNEDGWDVVLTDKNISEEYYNGSVKGRLSGLAKYAEQKLYIHSKKNDIRRALLHEFGHYWDYKCDIGSMAQEFEEIFISEKEFFCEKWKLDDHVTSNSQEYFAEAFAQLILYPELLAEKCPNTYNYVYGLMPLNDV